MCKQFRPALTNELSVLEQFCWGKVGLWRWRYYRAVFRDIAIPRCGARETERPLLQLGRVDNRRHRGS